MTKWFKKVIDWNGWHLIWAVLKSVPVFFLKTKTGRSLLLALLTRLGVAVSGDALAVILEVVFYLIVGNGIVNANEPLAVVKEIFQKELAKMKKDKDEEPTDDNKDSD